MIEGFVMPLNYEILNIQLNRYLTEKYSGVSLHTDIFEHAFLRFLGYQFVPEKCQFDNNSRNNSLSIFLRTPYEVETSNFLSDLRICTTGEFSGIRVEAIDLNSNPGKFCVCLSVPYSFIETYLSGIFQSINEILDNPLKIDFYRYWDIHAREYSVNLTIIGIENLICEKLLQYPYATFEDVWSAIIQKNIGKATKVNFLEKEVFVDVNNFPKIIMIYEENGKKNKMALTRDQIVTMLLEMNTLDKFLTGDSTLQEFIIPSKIKQFIEKSYSLPFFKNRKCDFEIDLGYHYKVRKTLEKYGIKEISSYNPIEGAERSHFYVYDKKNYPQLVLALKEMKGISCLDERWHQLTYYIRHQMWEQLNKELTFLLNLKTETDVEIDYTELLIRLYQYTKSNLQSKSVENVFEIIWKLCKNLVCDIQSQNEKQTEIYNILFELTLMTMSQQKETNEMESTRLKNDLFIFAHKAGLEESNYYLAEMAGLEFGSTFSENVNKNPLAVLLELAKKNKDTSEENARLKAEIAQLKATNSSGEVSASLNVNSASHFRLRN